MPLSGLMRFSLICLILQLCGCGTDATPQVLQYRQRYLLSEKPKGAISIEQARQSVQEDENVTLSVRIGSKDIPQWWSEDKATMIVSEGLEGSHYNLSNGHDPESCPFCRWKWKVENASAFVEFRDKNGAIIPLDCRTIFGFKENDQVLINGKGYQNEDGFLELIVDGLYVPSQNSDEL